MTHLGPTGLFFTSAGAHALVILYTLWRIRARAPVATGDKGSFTVVSPTRTSTPETAMLAFGETESSAAPGDLPPEEPVDPGRPAPVPPPPGA
ncbi:MAG: hypothetical protein NXH82_07730 [Rhodobacteraceae bacterium]|nr:hypothetical protein [Paracoccaceae bacterium]